MKTTSNFNGLICAISVHFTGQEPEHHASVCLIYSSEMGYILYRWNEEKKNIELQYLL